MSLAAYFLLTIKTSNAYEFGGIHEQCKHLETTDLSFKYEGETSFSINVASDGAAIGATNVTYKGPWFKNDMLFSNVGFYDCPITCEKSGATEENSMLGKENLLTLIGYELIECSAELVVPELLEFDFDKDGFIGYAIRYKTMYEGFQGSQGHLAWNVAFIKNTNGKLSYLSLNDKNFRSRSDIINAFYKKILIKNSELVLQYYVIGAENLKRDDGFWGVNRRLKFEQGTLSIASNES